MTLSNKSKDVLSAFLANYRTKTRFAEAYRTLRASINFSFLDRDFHSLLITSSGEGEGKTTTTANLAYAIAQTGKSVLMIDADMRKPMLSHIVPSNESIGLTGLLTDVLGTDVKSGSLEHFGLHDLLKLLALKKKTGFLLLFDGIEKVEFFFLKGQIASLEWLTKPQRKKLATVLIKNNLITVEQSKQALIRQEDTGQKLGFILISMGFVDEEDLTGFLTIHAIECFQTALNFRAGEFSFKGFSESDFDRASFNPVDFDRIYKQVLIGEEKFLFLQEKINSAILKTDTKNLFLLPVGKLPPNPSELLGSERMTFLISNLKKRFDTLIIDSPPILPARDALVLSPLSDGVVLALKPGYIDRQMIKKTVEQLNSVKANILGVVLSKVDTKKEGYFKYEQKYYSNYYGEKK